MFSTKTRKRIVFVIIIFAVLILYTFKNSSYFLRVASSVGTIIAVYTIDNLFGLEFKPHHYALIALMIATGFLLSPFYFIYPNYDKILHIVQPILLFIIVFYLVSRLDLPYKWELAFTFFSVVALLGIFEIGEYLLDLFFDLKLQGVFLRSIQGLEKYNILVDSNTDTMLDLSFGIISAGLYALANALWVVLRLGKKYLHIDSKFHEYVRKFDRKLAN